MDRRGKPLWREREGAVREPPDPADHRPQPQVDRLTGFAAQTQSRRLAGVRQTPGQGDRRIHTAVADLLRIDQIVRTL